MLGLSSSKNDDVDRLVEIWKRIAAIRRREHDLISEDRLKAKICLPVEDRERPAQRVGGTPQQASRARRAAVRRGRTFVERINRARLLVLDNPSIPAPEVRPELDNGPATRGRCSAGEGNRRRQLAVSLSARWPRSRVWGSIRITSVALLREVAGVTSVEVDEIAITLARRRSRHLRGAPLAPYPGSDGPAVGSSDPFQKPAPAG